MSIIIRFPTPRPRPAVAALKILNDSPAVEGVRLNIDDGTISAYACDVDADGTTGQAYEKRVKLPNAVLRDIKTAYLAAGRNQGELPPGDVEDTPGLVATIKPPVI